MQDRERDFNKDWYFKLNAAPGAEGRQVDVKDWKKLDLPHDWSIFFDFDHNSPAQNEGGQLNGGDAWYRKTFRLDDKDLDKKVPLGIWRGLYGFQSLCKRTIRWSLSKWLQCLFL